MVSQPVNFFNLTSNSWQNKLEKIGKVKYYKPKNNGIYKLLALIQSFIFNIEKEKYERFNLLGQLEPIKDFNDIF